MKLPRHGIVEIETLRRYGRVPAGTRAVGSFALWGRPVQPGQRRFEVLLTEISVGDDPRVVRLCVSSDFTARGDRPRTWSMMHRGKMHEFHAADLSVYLLQELTLALESQSTSTGAQRFRVVRAEWQDDAPLPGWVGEGLMRFGVDPTKGA